MHPALHIGLPTTHLDEARRFYADLLGTPPDKERDDYLRFVAFDGRLRLGLHAVAVLAPSTSTAHLGLAVVDAAEVARTAARLEAAGWSLQREDAVTCCWALQDKVWVTDPDGHRWEVYTVLAEADVAQDTASTCCDTGDAVVAVPAAGQGMLCAQGGELLRMTTAELPWARLRDELARWFRRRADDEALAEDLAHEVLARLVDHAPRLRSVASVGPWVHRVAGSVWVDHLRRTRPVGEIDLASVAAPTGDPEPVGGPLGAWTLAALASLPPGQAEAVRLVDVDGVSRAEAAARLGLTVKGLNSRVQRGRVALRQALTRCCEVALDARGGLVAWRARSGCCEG